MRRSGTINWRVLAGAITGLAALYLARRRAVPAARTAATLDLSRKGERRRVVVLGAGFGGLTAALCLTQGRPSLDVVLVDRHNYHLFTPLLYQVAANLVSDEDVVYPVRAVAYQHGFQFVCSEVRGIDLGTEQVQTDHGPIAYDYLIVALGSVTNFFGIHELEKRTLPLKTVPDAVRLRCQVLDALERAEQERDEARRRALLTFAIVGGGPTGLEFAGALAALIRDVAGREYPRLHPEDCQILVLEATGGVLPGMHAGLKSVAIARLAERGVRVALNTPVARVEDGTVITGDGRRIPAATIVWAAGVRANPLVADLPGERARGGRIVVNEELQLPGHPHVYVIGDAAAATAPGAGGLLPQIAPVAIQQARAVAENILRQERGQPLRPFRYRHLGNLVILGRHAAVAEVRGLRFNGWPAWAAWRLVHLAWLSGFRNKLEVLLDWAMVYVAPRQTARLDYEVTPRAPAVESREECR